MIRSRFAERFLAAIANTTTMKKHTTSQSAYVYVRTSAGLLVMLAGVALALFGIGQFSADAQQRKSTVEFGPNLVPPLFDCSQLHALGINMQENFRAGAINIYCGETQGGSPLASDGNFSIAQQVLGPLLGTTDVDLISPGPESGTHVTQSETFVSANPDNPNEIVVAYNDSRNAASNIFSGASVSMDGGNTFTRLTKSNGQSPFANTFGDPVVIYNKPTGTWFTVWLDGGCGGQGIGGYKSATASDPNSWTHFCIHNSGSDDRESGWADNNPSSPFFGRMYVSWNDFAAGGNLKVRYSTDNGLTWNNERQLAPASPFMRDVQITGDPVTGDVYVASMNEMGGGLTNRANVFYKSSDGGNSWTKTYTGPTFAGPGRTTCPNPYFACMFSGPSYWRHMGWGQPAVLNGTVSYVYDGRNTSNGDPADVFYIRSTDGGVNFSAPFKLNTDSTTKANWQPNISVGSDGSLVAVWYDERNATSNCQKGNTAVPCYQMFARKSTDGGATWGPDEPFSDVMSPLPNQPDSFIITEYAGDYDYSNSVDTTHLHPWTDGRVAVSNSSQQDAFFDREGGGGAITIDLRGRGQTKGNQHRAQLKWDPADGGNINILRDGNVVATVPDNGAAFDNLGPMTGTFSYQVCETDSGDCSNTIQVNVQ